jgi:hypothetical protein
LVTSASHHPSQPLTHSFIQHFFFVKYQVLIHLFFGSLIFELEAFLEEIQLVTFLVLVPTLNDGRISYIMTKRFDDVMESLKYKFEPIEPVLEWPIRYAQLTQFAETWKRTREFLKRVGAPKSLLEQQTKLEAALLHPYFKSMDEFQG